MDEQIKNREVWDAIQAGNLQRLEALVESDRTTLSQMTPFGSWLHVAASSGHVEIVKYLVEQGIEPNERGGILKGNALNLAASAGHLDVVRYLLSHGTELDISEPQRNPLFSAIYGGHKAVAALLLNQGIDARVEYSGQYMQGMSAADFARERGELEIAKMIEALT